jgi:hypothetical protein
MARVATEKVLGMMAGRTVESEMLSSSVVVRRSCGCGTVAVASGSLVLDAELEFLLRDRRFGLPEGVAAKLVEQLSPTALDAAFAREIEDLCAGWVDDRRPLDAVEKLLDGLVRSVRSLGSDPARRHQLESRLHDARIALGHAVERRETRRRVVSAESLYHLNEVTLSLIGDGNRSVYRLLREHFPTLGVRECHLSLYRDESLEHATYVLGHTEEGPVELPAGQRGFASRELVPKGVLSPFVRFEHVVVPLVHQDRQLGVALLKLGDPEVVHYEALREALAFVLGTLE